MDVDSGQIRPDSMTEVTDGHVFGSYTPTTRNKITAQTPGPAGEHQTSVPDSWGFREPEINLPLAPVVPDTRSEPLPRKRIGLPIVPIHKPPFAGERTLFHGVSPVGDKGDVSLKILLSRLGWEPGDPLMWRPRDGLIVIGRGEVGGLCIRRDSRLRLRSQIRRTAGIRPGDRVLLTADTCHSCLIIFPPHAFDAMVIDRLTEGADGGAS